MRHRVSQIQVLTLVHINLAARASLMDIGQQLAEVSQDAPDARWRAHFISIIDPLSEVSLLLANVYQYQASQPEQQAALLTLIHRVVERWSSHADHVVVGGDFNASLQHRIGYAGLLHIRAADARLATFLHDAGLTYEAPNIYTWHGANESMWLSRSGQASVSDAEAAVSPDPVNDQSAV